MYGYQCRSLSLVLSLPLSPPLPLSYCHECQHHAAFRLQYSLWGNKTDLSMLVDVANIDADQVAAAPLAAGASHPFVIVDEFEPLWQRLRSLRSSSARPRRIDIVLDNAGAGEGRGASDCFNPWASCLFFPRLSQCALGNLW